MTRTIKLLRKFFAVIIGVPILIIGIILIPIPGPGLLVSLLGLLILASEFDVAKPYRDKFLNELKKIINKAKAKRDEINEKYQ